MYFAYRNRHMFVGTKRALKYSKADQRPQFGIANFNSLLSKSICVRKECIHVFDFFVKRLMHVGAGLMIS